MAGKCVYELFSTHSLRQRSHSNRRHSVADDSCCCCCNCEQNEKCLRMLIKSLLHLIRRRNYYSYAWLIFWGTAFGAKHFNTRNQVSNQSKLNGQLWALKNTDKFLFSFAQQMKKGMCVSRTLKPFVFDPNFSTRFRFDSSVTFVEFRGLRKELF